MGLRGNVRRSLSSQCSREEAIERFSNGSGIVARAGIAYSSFDDRGQQPSAGAHPPPRNDFAPRGSQLPELRATNIDSKIDGITSGSFACPKFDGMPVITVH